MATAQVSARKTESGDPNDPNYKFGGPGFNPASVNTPQSEKQPDPTPEPSKLAEAKQPDPAPEPPKPPQVKPPPKPAAPKKSLLDMKQESLEGVQKQLRSLKDEANARGDSTAEGELWKRLQAADLDGLGIVVSERWYAQYHHILGHNLTFALIVSTVLSIFSSRRMLAWVTYCALFHLHIFMDFWGSGRDWGIAYWWPFRFGPGYWWMNPYGWDFYSWQNISAAFLLFCWTIWIAYIRKRTPLELLMPSLDRRLVGLPDLGGRGFEAIMPE